jgi:hypothetical protein
MHCDLYLVHDVLNLVKIFALAGRSREVLELELQRTGLGDRRHLPRRLGLGIQTQRKYTKPLVRAMTTESVP